MSLRRDSYRFDETLDSEKGITLIVRVRATASFDLIESFAVVLMIQHDTFERELVRIDGSQKERINIHYLFQNPPQKEYHNRPITKEVVDYYLDMVRGNWRWYYAQYNENYI